MSRITIFRRLSQTVFFGITGTWLTVGALRCPFGVPFVSCQSCPLTDCPGRYLQLPFLGLAGLSGLLLGRVFCGWACPVGFLVDIAGKVPKLRATVSRRFLALDRYLKPLKWVALAVTVYLVFALDLTAARPYPYVVRTSSVFNLEAVRLAQSLGDPTYAIAMWVLIGALVGGLVVSRLWCRYLCPVAGLLGLTNKVSLFGLIPGSERLPRSTRPPRDCIMLTKPGSTDCVMCGECVRTWRRSRLGLRLRYGRGRSAEEEAEEPEEVERDAS